MIIFYGIDEIHWQERWLHPQHERRLRSFPAEEKNEQEHETAERNNDPDSNPCNHTRFQTIVAYDEGSR